MMKQITSIVFVFFTLTVFSQSAKHACSSMKIKYFNEVASNKTLDLLDLDKYDEKFVKLELEVSSTTKYISGKCTHLVQVTENNVNSFLFELSNSMTVSDVKLNGGTTNFIHNNDELSIQSPFTHTVGQLVNLEIQYSGTPPPGGGFNSQTGVFNDFSPNWGTQVTWTLSEPYVAHTWWPCKQILTDKIDSIEMIFITSDSLKVGSNGLLINEQTLPNNKVKYSWKSNYPIAYYLLSFAVAPYQEYSYKILPNGATDSLLIQNYIYKDSTYLPSYENDILETGEMIHSFTEKFGPYPFLNEKYGHCIAPLGGGMEHQTMTTQGYFANWLTAHELGHQWWGDNVTCSTWGDIWLNEGFASYSEYIYYQELQSQNDADSDMQQRHNNIMSYPGGSVYVQNSNDPNAIFNGRLVYNKGAAVVHMIRNYINDDSLFFHTLKKYQTVYNGSTTSTTDLKNLFLQETNIDLTDFFDAWIYGEGYPTYNGKFNTLDDTLFLQVSQLSSIGGSGPFYPALLGIELFFENGTDSIVQVNNVSNNQNFFFEFDEIVDSVFIDPTNWIINKQNEFIEDTTFVFEIINSLEDINEILVTVENPISDLISLHFNENKDIESVEIFNISGAFLYKNYAIENDILLINSNNWEKGVYLLLVKTKNNTSLKKLLKP